MQACRCDPGFFGTDCSQRMCPTGDDPLTVCPTTKMGGAIQEIKITLGSKLNLQFPSGAAGFLPPLGSEQFDSTSEGMSLFGTSDTVTVEAMANSASSYSQIRVGYTDAYGNGYIGRTAASSVFNLNGAGETSLKVALENTPKVKSVTVSSAMPVNAYGSYSILERRYVVTFTPDYVSSVNVGQQNALLCSSGYGCSGHGCSPMVSMPFLYRYGTSVSYATDLTTSATPTFNFFAGQSNSASSFTNKYFIRLDASSTPRMPLNMVPDASLTSSDPTGVRYDARLLVAVQDSPGGVDDAVDMFWTRVVYGHLNISSETFEWSNGLSGVWSTTSSKPASFNPSLLGFTFQGFIPSAAGSNGGFKATIPEAPGMILEFPSRNMVGTDGYFTFYEILVKLPSCKVTPLVVGDEFTSATGTALTPVDSKVENVECSNRGQCNRDTGMCECYSGFYGVSCSRQTTMV